MADDGTKKSVEFTPALLDGVIAGADAQAKVRRWTLVMLRVRNNALARIPTQLTCLCLSFGRRGI